MLVHSTNACSENWARLSWALGSWSRSPAWKAGTQLLQPSLLPPRVCGGEKLGLGGGGCALMGGTGHTLMGDTGHALMGDTGLQAASSHP